MIEDTKLQNPTIYHTVHVFRRWGGVIIITVITEFQFESAEEEKSICELGFFSFVFWSRILTFEKSYYLE